MKSILISLIIGVLLGNCGTVFAKDPNKDKAASRQRVNIDRKSRIQQVESERAKLRERAKRAHELKQQSIRKQDQQKKRRMSQVYSPEATEYSQKHEAIKNKIAQEEAKHQSRLARLNRIRELAKEENDSKALERVDKLLKKENRRFVKKQRFFQNKSQKIIRPRRTRIGPDARRVDDADKRRDMRRTRTRRTRKAREGGREDINKNKKT